MLLPIVSSQRNVCNNKDKTSFYTVMVPTLQHTTKWWTCIVVLISCAFTNSIKADFPTNFPIGDIGDKNSRPTECTHITCQERERAERKFWEETRINEYLHKILTHINMTEAPSTPYITDCVKTGLDHLTCAHKEQAEIMLHTTPSPPSRARPQRRRQNAVRVNSTLTQVNFEAQPFIDPSSLLQFILPENTIRAKLYILVNYKKDENTPRKKKNRRIDLKIESINPLTSELEEAARLNVKVKHTKWQHISLPYKVIEDALLKSEDRILSLKVTCTNCSPGGPCPVLLLRGSSMGRRSIANKARRDRRRRRNRNKDEGNVEENRDGDLSQRNRRQNELTHAFDERQFNRKRPYLNVFIRTRRTQPRRVSKRSYDFQHRNEIQSSTHSQVWQPKNTDSYYCMRQANALEMQANKCTAEKISFLFEEDLSWDFILEPKGLDLDVCVGVCEESATGNSPKSQKCCSPYNPQVKSVRFTYINKDLNIKHAVLDFQSFDHCHCGL